MKTVKKWSNHCFALAVVFLAAQPVLSATAPTPFIGTAGEMLSPKTVTMGVKASIGNSIHFTTDGSTPNGASTTYLNPFTVTTSTTLKAISIDGSPNPVATLYIDLPSVYLDAEEGIVPATGNPNPVIVWTDQSGNSNSASAISGQDPKLLPNSINDLAAIEFSGQYFNLPAGFADFTKGVSIFIVAKTASLTAGATLLDIGNGSSGNNIKVRISNTGSKAEFDVYSGTTSSAAQSASALSTSEYTLIEAVLVPNVSGTDATGTIYVNGQAGTPVTNMFLAANTSRSINTIGAAAAGSSPYSGKIAELLIFPNAINNRQDVEAVLLQKFDLLRQQPPTPQISVAGGNKNGPTQVVISSADDTSVLHVTTDGTTPNASSPIFNGCPILINYTTTLKAIAVKNGISSSVASETYTLNADQCPTPSPSDMVAPTINLTVPVQSQ